MKEFLYFVAGIVVAVVGIAISLRIQPKKRLCGFVESTKTFDKEWVFSAESVRFLYDDVEADQVIHHVFYVWNGGSSAIRSADLPAGYLAKIRFSEERVALIDLNKVGAAFEASLRTDDTGWQVVVDHLDRGHGFWCHFIEAVPVEKDPGSITIEGYVIEGGEILTEVRPVPIRIAAQALRLPAILLPLATLLVGVLQLARGQPTRDLYTLWLLVAALWIIIPAVSFRSIRDILGAYRYRVPPQFQEIYGKFERHWRKHEVESRLGVRFPN